MLIYVNFSFVFIILLQLTYTAKGMSYEELDASCKAEGFIVPRDTYKKPVNIKFYFDYGNKDDAKIVDTICKSHKELFKDIMTVEFKAGVRIWPDEYGVILNCPNAPGDDYCMKVYNYACSLFILSLNESTDKLTFDFTCRAHSDLKNLNIETLKKHGNELLPEVFGEQLKECMRGGYYEILLHKNHGETVMQYETDQYAPAAYPMFRFNDQSVNLCLNRAFQINFLSTFCAVHSERPKKCPTST